MSRSQSKYILITGASRLGRQLATTYTLEGAAGIAIVAFG